MAEGFLGTGWRFGPDGIGLNDPRARNPHFIAEASDEELVQQSIWLILSTAPGERVMRPDFGCGIHDLVFANPSAGTLGEVAREVTRALTLWEPRVHLLRVEAHLDRQNPACIIVEIDAQIRSTNSRFNFVYPFYMS